RAEHPPDAPSAEASGVNFQPLGGHGTCPRVCGQVWLLDEARRRLHAGQPRVRRPERELADLPHRALRPHHPAGVPANGTPALDLPPGRGSGTDCRVGMLRTATHVLLALALVVTTTGLTGRVLCLGGDGHREIEARDAACCGAKAPGNGPALDARCAGECVD